LFKKYQLWFSLLKIAPGSMNSNLSLIAVFYRSHSPDSWFKGKYQMWAKQFLAPRNVKLFSVKAQLTEVK